MKGKTELGKGSRASKYYELCDFELCLNGKKIREMLENEEKKEKKGKQKVVVKDTSTQCRNLYIRHN
ncbi:hypothetical protein C5S39_05220 [Candidatus Methanophagaceae archaeon]|nr:hypothetical protein C5S39_05220 [Methanophagales archaeon]